MDSDLPPKMDTDSQLESWEQFRRNCFLEVVDSVYCWSAGCPAEAHTILLHLMTVTGFRYDLDKRALVFVAYDARHLIPVAHLTLDSLQYLLTAQRGHERDSMEALHKAVYERYGFDTPQEDIGDAATIH